MLWWAGHQQRSWPGHTQLVRGLGRWAAVCELALSPGLPAAWRVTLELGPGRLVDKLHAGTSAEPLSEAVVAFAAHIKSGEPVPVGWYNLPDGVFFLGEKDGFGNKLKIRQAEFIALVRSAPKRLASNCATIVLACRQAYVDLYEFLERKDAEGRPVYRQVVVSGNPGVGRSMFLVYYLLRYVCHSA